MPRKKHCIPYGACLRLAVMASLSKLLYVFVTCCLGLQTPLRRSMQRRVTWCSNNDTPGTINEVEWGTSFIGCDVCASKVNDDPFGDETKPMDAWSAMRKKIADAEKRLTAEAEAEKAAAALAAVAVATDLGNRGEATATLAV